MPGYSGKPLSIKLGLVPNQEIVVINKPVDYERLIKIPLHITDTIVPTHFIHIFVTKQAELTTLQDMIIQNLDDKGMVWVSWPKKTSQVSTDITENIVRDILLPTGLVDIKVCAIDETWSGLKFVWRKR